ncbi:MAG TPA: hypothetical protein VG323_06645 [Thermoanaerobaculia bacterium]|nr:hypothetical protein [Thermoanaerobaculia bacterium]
MSQWVDQPLTRDLLVLGVVILSVVAVLVVRRLAPPHALKESNDFVGFAYAFVGVVYGVYLAFTAVIVWEHFDNTASIVSREAEEVNELWHDAGGLPDGAAVRPLWREYARIVAADDWKTMAESDGAPMPSARLWTTLWQRYTSMRIAPGDVTGQAFLSESLRVLNELAATRRERLTADRAEVPAMMWMFVIAGGAGILVMTLFIGVQHRLLQIAVTAFVAALLAYAILIVAALADPFGGDVSVKPDAFLNVVKAMDAESR